MDNRKGEQPDDVDPDEVLEVFNLCRSDSNSWPLFWKGKLWREEARAEVIEKFGEAKAAELLDRLLEYDDGYMCMEDRISGKPRKADGRREIVPLGLGREIYEERVSGGYSIPVWHEAVVRLDMFRIAFPECPRDIRNYLFHHYCIKNR